MERWLAKTAVITGAAGGIGRAVCENLSKAGMKVVGLDMKNLPADKGDKSSNVQFRKCDVTSLKDIKDAFQWVEECMGGTDVLVNCAGYSSSGQITGFFLIQDITKRVYYPKMNHWVGRTAVVTGASAGIGSAVCVELANAGMRVVGFARRAHLVDSLKSQVTGTGSIHSCACDVGKTEQIDAAFQWVEQQFGGVDVLVNNAGIFVPGQITEAGTNPLTDEDIASIIDCNLKGMIFCTRHAVASMRKRNFDGHIVNINSIAGHYIPFSPEFNVYGSSKHGVTGFNGSLNNELAHFKSKIKVTSLSPGFVSTNMTAKSLKLVDFEPLQPKDIADAVLYVLSTPPNVNITELTIQPVAEKRL